MFVIDPDAMLGPIAHFMGLDTLNLYGAKIWMFYKDVCGENISTMLAVLRGFQLGFVSNAEVRHAVDNCGEGINVADICAKVCERLPAFKLTVA